jgi:Family of unknown function (DUF6134)
MLTRRHLLVAGAAMAAAGRAQAALPVPHGNSMAFRLMRHGSAIGTHALAFRDDGDTLEVNIAVEVLVKFGPIPFVRYAHHNRETWQGERLVGLNARTDRNGTRLQMSAAWTDAGLRVEGSGTRPYIAPPNAFATTYWRQSTLFGPLIGTQDGMLVHPAISQQQPAPIRTASGEVTPAKRYVLSGDLKLELWYDASDSWDGMRFTVDDGSEISYERL